jgi:hypothetical protein
VQWGKGIPRREKRITGEKVESVRGDRLKSFNRHLKKN